MDFYFEKEDLAKFGQGKLRENAEEMWDSLWSTMVQFMMKAH